MKKYATIGILSFLILVLLSIVFVLLWNFRSDSNLFPQFISENNTSTPTVAKKLMTWQQELASWPVHDFTPAAQQFHLYFNIDTSELKEKSKYYQLIINKYDLYSIFCLKQTLNAFQVKYFLLKSSGNTEIFIDTDNKKLIEEIIIELKKYKINTQAKEIWL